MYTQMIIIFFLLFIKKIHNYIKKISSPYNYNFFCLLNIRMVNPALNLSLNELRLIAEHRNISDYENKFAEDLIFFPIKIF